MENTRKGLIIKRMVEPFLNVAQSFHRLQVKCVHPFKGIYPCRSCANCRSARANYWAHRQMVEFHRADYAHVVTLTFTDDMLDFGTTPAMLGGFIHSCGFYSSYNEDGTFQNIRTGVVNIKDFQLFIKRLRKALKKYDIQVKYVAKGEYGDEIGRPHIHTTLYYYCEDEIPPVFFFEEQVAKAWFNAIIKYHKQDVRYDASYNKGKVVRYNPIIEIDRNVTMESVKYVAKYVTKDLTLAYSDASVYYPEWFTSSRGLGVEIDEEQVEESRKILDSYADRVEYTEEDLPLVTKAISYKFLDSKDRFFMPSSIKRYVCGGYYKYNEYDKETVEARDIKILSLQKEFVLYDRHATLSDKILAEKRWITFQKFQVVYNHFSSLEFARKFRLVDESSDTADVFLELGTSEYNRLSSILQKHIDHIEEINENRTKGAESKLLQKHLKKQSYVEQKRQNERQRQEDKHSFPQNSPF